MKRFLTLGIRVVLCLALVAEARDRVIMVPPHCVEVDDFQKPCKAAKYGGYDCEHVHIRIKALPECTAFDHQRILQVPK